MENMLAAVERARARPGAAVLTGGHRLTGAGLRRRLLRGAHAPRGARRRRRDLAASELFGPITCLYPRAELRRGDRAGQRLAVRADRRDPHRSINRAHDLPRPRQAGVAVVNGGTYGSEPHMPFGGLQAVGQRLARGGHPGAGRLLRLEDGLHPPRPRRCVRTSDRDAPQRVVALIPAASGSKRIPGKNVRLLRGHPLLAYTIARGARQRRVRVGHRVDRLRGDRRDRPPLRRRVPFLRPAAFAGDTSPDIEWVRHTLERAARRGGALVTASPAAADQPVPHGRDDPAGVATLFAARTARLAAGRREVRAASGQDVGLDAGDQRMSPLLDDGGADPPWHSTPYQALPPVYVQNASLEIAWSRTVDRHGSIAGDVVVPWSHRGLRRIRHQRRDGLDAAASACWRQAVQSCRGRRGRRVATDTVTEPTDVTDR